MDIGFVWDMKTNTKEFNSSTMSNFTRWSLHLMIRMDMNFPDPEGHEGRWMLVARSTGGRELAIVFSEEDLPVYRLITAFDADEGLRG